MNSLKQLRSLDIHFLLKELKELQGCRVDKVYNKGSAEIYVQLYKTNVGKKILKIIVGKALFLTQEKLVDDIPSEFCKLLRKHLDGKFLDSISQLEPERIVKLVFKAKDYIRELYLEIFAKGNVILCNNDSVIINCLIHHKFKDRAIIPKEKYKYPHMEYSIFGLKRNDVKNLLKNSKKDKIVTSLAVELGLGGVYSEEICLLGNIDKNIEPKKLGEDKIKNISLSIKKIILNKINPQIIYEDKAIDVTPIDLEFYNACKKTKFSDFNEAVSTYFTKELKLPKEESVYSKNVNELKRIIEEQKITIESLKNKEDENRKKAEMIYNNYQLIKGILDEINKASKKYSWSEVKEKLKGHKIVKDVDVKEKSIVIQI